MTHSHLLEILEKLALEKRNYLIDRYYNNPNYDLTQGLYLFDEELKKIKNWILHSEKYSKHSVFNLDHCYEEVLTFLKTPDIFYLNDTPINITPFNDTEFDYLYEEDIQIQNKLEEKTKKVLKEICTNTCTILDVLPAQEKR